MLQSEFIERTGLQVTAECYHEFIEPEYDGSTLNKDEWCKQWKRNGGIAKAYSWQVRHDAEKLQKMEDASNENRALKLRNERLENENETYKRAYEEAKERLHEIRKKLNIFTSSALFTL